MLTLLVAEREFYDDSTQSFITVPNQTICLEHSLISLRRWEAIWKKPYLSKSKKTHEETLSYIQCMSVNKDITLETAKSLSGAQLETIRAYIDDPMTATTFTKDNTPPNREIMTAELIYQQMISLQIPIECQKWHLNQLLTLIRVCAIRSQPPKKMSKKELMSRNRKLNEMRRAQMNSKG